MSTKGPVGAAKIQQTLARAQAFTEKLLEENARLRNHLAQARIGAAGGKAPTPEAAELREQVKELEGTLATAQDKIISLSAGGATATPDSERLARLERELSQSRQRQTEIEEQSNNLANLYVASYQLHSTLDFKEVIAIVMEIVTNLIGAESFCLMLLDGKSSDLCTIAAEGMERTPSARIKLGDGIIGKVAQTGENYYRKPDDPGQVDLLHPMAAIPLKIQQSVIGVISVYSLFPQKAGFQQVDYELFNLLAGHAATAIFSAKIYSESERKLSTIQSFLDLLTTS